jgi:F0F1-type ATP synthase assembly protein I
MKKWNSKEGNKKAWWQPALIVFARMSGWIVFPVLAGLFLGKWLDGKLGTDPWLFLAVIGLAFAISVIGLAKTAREELGKMEEEDKDKNNKGGNNK